MKRVTPLRSCLWGAASIYVVLQQGVVATPLVAGEALRLSAGTANIPIWQVLLRQAGGSFLEFLLQVEHERMKAKRRYFLGVCLKSGARSCNAPDTILLFLGVSVLRDDHYEVRSCNALGTVLVTLV